MKKKILVTGGAGFVGSHLCERLVVEGHQVTCLDNFYTGSPDNCEYLLKFSNFEIVERDVSDQFDGEFDQIYNLACPASPVHYQASPTNTIKTSVVGMQNMLDLARENGATLLQASTSEVYGDPEIHPQPETYWGNVNSFGERACYDEGKRCAEALCYAYMKEFGVGIRIARIFNTYGPRMQKQDGRVVSNFIVQALTGQPITIYGDGGQTRSFCYVDDLVEGLIRLMNTNGATTSRPINLGNPVEFTMLELADLVKELAGSRSKITYRPLPVDDPKQRRPDITLARAELNWTPIKPLREGLLDTIAYFEKVLYRNTVSAADKFGRAHALAPETSSV